MGIGKTISNSNTQTLKGRNEIAEFVGQTVSVAQRWEKEGMPITREDGRSMLHPKSSHPRWAGNAGKKSPFTLLAKARTCWEISNKVFLMFVCSRKYVSLSSRRRSP
jgi:hypothetical protein